MRLSASWKLRFPSRMTRMSLKQKRMARREANMLRCISWKDGCPTYYIFCSHGLSPSSWEFWDDIQ